MSRVAIITDNAVGGTFITWSILWLSGQSEYFSAYANRQLNLVSNPITDKNSHRFKVNQAIDITDVETILSKLPKDNNLHHLYFHILRRINQAYTEEDSLNITKQGIELAAKHCDKVIVINNHKEYGLYNCTINQRHAPLSFDGSHYIHKADEALEDFINHFFRTSLTKWGNFDNVWDKREFIALNFNPYQKLYIRDCHDFDFECFNLPAHAAWLSLDIYIKDILDYCNLCFDEIKFEQWQQVYNQWKRKHQDRIQFCWFFNTIIENILAGKDMDLTKFNLDIVREAAIQHELIYKHNLNFKTWQLEKFINTKQLHNLLEPNIHSLSS